MRNYSVKNSQKENKIVPLQNNFLFFAMPYAPTVVDYIKFPGESMATTIFENIVDSNFGDKGSSKGVSFGKKNRFF